MEADWRSQICPAARERIIIQLTETLKRHVPTSTYEELDELNRFATRFEKETYDCSTTQCDYLRKISLKMLSLKTKTPVAASIILPDGIQDYANSGGLINSSGNPSKRSNSEAEGPYVKCQVEGESSAKKIKVSGEKIAPAFSCPICMNTMESLWSTICGHIFCETCIKYALVKQKQCPTCRKILIMENCIHKIFLPNVD